MYIVTTDERGKYTLKEIAAIQTGGEKAVSTDSTIM
jgi:hypothetical protein